MGTGTWDRNTQTGTPYTPQTQSQGTSNSQSTSESQQSSFSGIANPEALASLLKFVQEAAAGGSESFKKQQADRNMITADTQKLQGNYSKEAAFQDAAMLMQQMLQKSMEANMPAIAKSITGAGTSSSSMQGLLSEKLATDSAQASGALGAEQAKAYGGIQASLAATLEALSRINTDGEQNFLKALELLKVSSSQGTSSSQQTSNSQQTAGTGSNTYTSGGGGSTSPFTTVGDANVPEGYITANEYNWL